MTHRCLNIGEESIVHIHLLFYELNFKFFYATKYQLLSRMIETGNE